MSYLKDWLQAHNLEAEQARRESGVDDQIFDILLHGGKTVPGIALIIGHNLGMKPQEVRQLGITPDADLRKDWQPFFMGNPWHLDPKWWTRVGTYNAQAEHDLLYGAPKKPPEQHAATKNHVVKKPLRKREDYYGQGVCRYCGETYTKKAREQLYCSKHCATKDRRRLG